MAPVLRVVPRAVNAQAAHGAASTAPITNVECDSTEGALLHRVVSTRQEYLPLAVVVRPATGGRCCHRQHQRTIIAATATAAALPLPLPLPLPLTMGVAVTLALFRRFLSFADT